MIGDNASNYNAWCVGRVDHGHVIIILLDMIHVRVIGFIVRFDFSRFAVLARVDHARVAGLFPIYLTVMEYL